MRNKPRKLVAIMIVMAIVMAPLQGLFADVFMDMGQVDQDQVTVMGLHDSMAAGDIVKTCDQCDMKQCCQVSNCNSGHCFSCMAIVSPDFYHLFTQFIHRNQYTYQLSSISFQTSPLLQPPIA